MRGVATWRLVVMLTGVVVFAGLSACASTTTTVKTIPVPTASKSSLTVIPDQKHYSTGQAIGVTVTNGTGSNLYAWDGHTACTFLQLQEYSPTRKEWMTVLPCATGQTPQARLIPTALPEPFTLAPGNNAANANQWDVGIYRVALVFSYHADGSSAAQTIYSQGFQIKATS